MEIIEVRQLSPNPWNTNSLTPESERKLDESIRRNGMFKPVVVRSLKDGRLEIIGGQHRWESCVRLGIEEIPIFNLGNIDDRKAKEISVIDNGRYGSDDIISLGNLLKEIGPAEELLKFLPLQSGELEAIESSSKIDLDSLGEDVPLEESDEIVEKPAKRLKTHVTMRFTVPIESHGFIERVIADIIKENGFDDPDAQINAGDALMKLARSHDEYSE